MDTRRCKYCDREFVPCPRVKNQQYCSDRTCQRARKRLWQKEKLGRDKDYRLNQKAAQKVWRAKNSGYWKVYRDKHPQYVNANRENQRKRRDLKLQESRLQRWTRYKCNLLSFQGDINSSFLPKISLQRWTR